MALSKSEFNSLVAEITNELGAKTDGSKKNIIARCPFCGKADKFGIFIGKETEKRKHFMSHCFSCGMSTKSLNKLLEVIGRPDLMLADSVNLSEKLDVNILFPLNNEEEIDDSLSVIELPDFYKRTFSNPYLKSRGFCFDDYEYFPAGTTNKLNRKFDDYVIFPIIDEGDTVGYVARHTWSKAEIDLHNRKAKYNGEYKILRFRNSTENDFVKLLYNYDSVIEDETDTVIIVEGIFDVIALTRKLELYDNEKVAVVATFGKKISPVQIYKLQRKGVKTVVIGYDGDAVEATKKIASEISPYFDVFIADIPDPQKDWEDLTLEEIFDVFDKRLMTPMQYKLSKIQEYK